MNLIVKKRQINRAIKTYWVGMRPQFSAAPDQSLSVIDYLERSRPADVVFPHIHKIKQLRSVYRRHP
jgi:hypothetical protein